MDMPLRRTLQEEDAVEEEALKEALSRRVKEVGEEKNVR